MCLLLQEGGQRDMSNLVTTVDIGSNSVRTLLCAMENDTVKIIGSERFVTRLLAGVDSESGALSESKIAQLTEILAGIVEDARARGCNDFMFAATHVLRAAANRNEVVAAVKNETGIGIDILSPGLEGLLAYAGACEACCDINGTVPVIDVGGGSSEIILPSDGSVEVLSIDAGAVNSVSRFADICAPVSSVELNAVLKTMESEFAGQIESAGLKGLCARCVVGVGGSAFTMKRMLAAVGRAMEGDTVRIVRADIESVLQGLCGLSAGARCEKFGIGRDRADIIVAGLCVWLSLCRILGTEKITISAHGVGLGLAMEFFGLIGKAQ